MSTMSIGLSMFGAMLVLMAVRVPIAIAMFVPGAVGYLVLAGWMPLLSHLKGAVYGRVSVYDLSVIPLFMLMGAFAVHGGLVEGAVRLCQRAARPLQGRHGDGRRARLRGLRLDLGLDRGHHRHHRPGGLPGDAAHQLLGAPGHRGAGHRRHHGRAAAAVGDADGLRHPDRTEHHQDVPRGLHPGAAGGRGLLDRHRRDRAPASRPGARRAGRAGRRGGCDRRCACGRSC